MASHDDHKDRDKDHGGSKSSHGSSSHGSGKDSHGFGKESREYSGSAFSPNKSSGKASHYDSSKLVGEDANFFGLEVTQGTASQFNLFYQTALPFFRRYLQDKGTYAAREFGQKYLGHVANSAHNIKFGNEAANVIGVATIFSKQLWEIGDTIYDTTKQLNTLNQASGSLQRAGASGNGGLFAADADEGLANARAKVNRVFAHRMLMTMAGAVSAVPQFWIWSNENKAKHAAQKKLEEYADIKNKTPEEQAKWFQEQMQIKMPMGLSGGKAKQAFIEAEEKEYLAKFKKFKSENEARISSELRKELLDKKGTERSEWDVDKRGRYDIPQLKNNKKVSELSLKDRRRYEQDVKKAVDKAVEETIRGEFVRKEGYFDEGWRKYLTSGMSTSDKYAYNKNSGEKSIRSRLEEQYDTIVKDFNKLTDEDRGAHAAGKDGHPKKDGETSKVMDLFAGAIGGVMGDVAMNLFGGKKLDQFKQKQALDRVLHLQRVLEKAEGNTPDLVPGIKLDKESERDCSYAQYVHKIFQQHQQDSIALGKKDFAEIGERYFEKLEKAKWNDEAIQKLNDDELNPYEFAIKHMAKDLKLGLANGNTVGAAVFNSKRKFVRNSGKEFGPEDIAHKDEATVKAGILAEWGRLVQHSASSVAMDERAVGEALGRFSFSTTELKQAFSSNGLQGDERVFFFALVNAHMPDPKVLCRVTGLTDSECEHLRKDMQGRFEKFMDAGVAEIAEMLKQDPKALDKLQITEDEKKLLTNLAAQSAREGRDVTDIIKNKKEMQAAETVVANVTMDADGPGKPGGFWQKLVERSARPKVIPPTPPAAATAHADDKHPHDHHDETPKKSFAERLPERSSRASRHEDSGDFDHPRDQHRADHGNRHNDHGKDRDHGRDHDSWIDAHKPSSSSSHASRFRDDGDEEGHSMLGKVRRGSHENDGAPTRRA